MPLCGFNEKMLEGLSLFNEGLVEYGLLERSHLNGETIDQAIKREISDMTRFLAEIHRLDDSSKRMLTEGLTRYAMGFYLLMRSREVGDYKKVIQKLASYFKFMDDEYYSELEGKPNDMLKLAQLLNEKEI